MNAINYFFNNYKYKIHTFNPGSNGFIILEYEYIIIIFKAASDYNKTLLANKEIRICDLLKQYLKEVGMEEYNLIEEVIFLYKTNILNFEDKRLLEKKFHKDFTIFFNEINVLNDLSSLEKEEICLTIYDNISVRNLLKEFIIKTRLKEEDIKNFSFFLKGIKFKTNLMEN